MPQKTYFVRPGFRLTVSDPSAPDGVANKFHGDFVLLDDEAAEQYRDAVELVNQPDVADPTGPAEPAEGSAATGGEVEQ